VTRVVAGVVAVLAALTVATGVYLSFRYRPDAHGTGRAMQPLHAVSAVLLAIVLVVGLAAFVWERRPDRRHGLPAFVGIGLLALVLVVETRLGSRLAWDLAPGAVTASEHGIAGVWLDHLPVEFLLVGAAEVGVADFRRRVWLHVAVLPAVVALGAGLVVWWVRRFGRPEARQPKAGR
jgi:hypothetical protein